MKKPSVWIYQRGIIVTLTCIALMLMIMLSPKAGAIEQTGTGEQSNSQSGTSTELQSSEQTNRQTKAESRRSAQDRQSSSNGQSNSAKGRTAEQRQKVCQARQNGINNRRTAISNSVQRIQARLDKVFEKSQAYVTNNSLSPAGYQSLVDQANAAKQASSSTSEALKQKAATPIDCANSSVSGELAGFKSAATEARQNLKKYRSSVKDLLQAIRQTDNQPQTNSSNENRQ